MVLLVSRASRFSPSCEDKDAATLRSVEEKLAGMGFEVTRVSEDDLAEGMHADGCVSMARSGRALSLLEGMKRGEDSAPALHLNAPEGVRRISVRSAVIRFVTEGTDVVEAPRSCLLHADGSAEDLQTGRSVDFVSLPWTARGCWLKKDSGCAELPTDVQYAPTTAAMTSAVAAMRGRGVGDILVMEHLEGRLLKCYGVAGTPFFRCYEPRPDEAKFAGQCRSADAAGSCGPEPDEKLLQALKRAMDAKARELGVACYGLDVILADGRCIVIDFNDFPSYSRYRDEAAQAIAERVAADMVCLSKPPLAETLSGVKGILFDYGGTLDTDGCHWGQKLWQSYRRVGVPVDESLFRDAYVHGERTLGSRHIIEPSDDFFDLLAKKLHIELDYIRGRRPGFDPALYADALLDDLRREVTAVVERNRASLSLLRRRWPLVMVSNFYGNLPTVLRRFGLDGFFDTVVESAVVGVRKPDPAIFRLGVEAIGLEASEVLVIGDSYDKDIVPARQVGCRTVMMVGQPWKPAPLEAADADWAVTSLDDFVGQWQAASGEDPAAGYTEEHNQGKK